MRGLGPAHRHHHHLLTRLSAAKGGFAVTELVETAEERQTEPLRVLLVDDHDLFRTGLRNLLEEQELEIVGEAATGTEANPPAADAAAA